MRKKSHQFIILVGFYLLYLLSFQFPTRFDKSLDIKKYVGIPAIITNNNDAAAVSMKNASLAELQILVDKVLKPIGLKINVAGSSFRQRINIKIVA